MTKIPDWSGGDAGPPADPPPYPSSDAPYPSGPSGPAGPYAYPPGPPGPHPVGYPSYGDYFPQPPRNGMGTAALVTGLLGLFSSPTVAGGVILGIAAVILGLIGRARYKRGEATNGGVALGGTVVGVIAVIVGLGFVAFWVGLFNQVGAGDYFDCLQQAGQDKAKMQLCSEEFRQSMADRLSVTPTP